MPDEIVASALVVTYNQDKYIGETLDSILAQKTRFPFEVIVGEDCSKDRTREIVLDYQTRFPEKVCAITSDHNVGLLANVKRCEEAARGKYIAYCGGDDLWSDPTKLQRQVDFLEANPDHTMVHSDHDVLIGKETIRRSKKSGGKSTPTGWVYEDLLQKGCFAVASTVCWRTETYRQFAASPFYDRPYLMEDYPRQLFSARAGKIGFIDESLATYRVIPGSMMRSSSQSMLRMWTSARQVCRDFINEYGCPPELRARVERVNNVRVLGAALAAEDRRVFNEEYDWMLANNPEWLGQLSNRLRTWMFRYHLGWLYRQRDRIRWLFPSSWQSHVFYR